MNQHFPLLGTMASFFRLLAPFFGILSCMGILLSYSYLSSVTESQTFSVNYIPWAKVSLPHSHALVTHPLYPQLTYSQDCYSKRSYTISQIPGVGIITGFADGRILG